MSVETAEMIVVRQIVVSWYGKGGRRLGGDVHMVLVVLVADGWWVKGWGIGWSWWPWSPPYV